MPSDIISIISIEESKDMFIDMPVLEVITLRNQLKSEGKFPVYVSYLTHVINEHQKPIAQFLRGNSNSSKNIEH